MTWMKFCCTDNRNSIFGETFSNACDTWAGLPYFIEEIIFEAIFVVNAHFSFCVEMIKSALGT